MTSMVLEWPGRWRAAGIAVLLALPLLPALPSMRFAVFSGERFSWGDATFEHALANSAIVACAVTAGSFALGLPIGVLNALYDYRGRRFLLALSLLPLLVPSFLWPLGWRWLLEHRGRWLLPLLSGHCGCVLIFLPGAVALVLMATATSVAGLSRSQVEAARLSGGEWTLFRSVCRHASVLAALAAVLAGILTLSDPAAGFAVKLPLASSEILVSFTAFYDYALAGRQCVVLTLVVLATALPIAWLASPRLVAELSARQFRPTRRSDHPVMARAAGATLFGLVLMLTLLPTVGLILPLRRWSHVLLACDDLARTGMNTVMYAAGAGFVATILGFAVACCAGREERLRRLVVGVSLGLSALPPMFLGLGFVHGVAQMPAWTDPILRGRLAVCLALGIRFFPVAALLALRSWGTMSPSLAGAAGIHGVSLGRFLWHVVLPQQRRAAFSSLLLVGLLATAEIGMVLLLYPPGEESLPLHIFQIIGYPAPSSRLAALCAVDLALAIGLLGLAWRLGGGHRA